MPKGYPGTVTHGIAGSGCKCVLCRSAQAKYLREYRKTPKGKAYVRKMNLRASYGITPEEYQTKLDAQSGVCAACKQPETGHNQYGTLPLAVDHDHTTNEKRGLLCMRCNRALGLLHDDVARISSLLLYRMEYN